MMLESMTERWLLGKSKDHYFDEVGKRGASEVRPASAVARKQNLVKDRFGD
jgi:hypothetical protein